jgi:hypothetical protein
VHVLKPTFFAYREFVWLRCECGYDFGLYPVHGEHAVGVLEAAMVAHREHVLRANWIPTDKFSVRYFIPGLNLDEQILRWLAGFRRARSRRESENNDGWELK